MTGMTGAALHQARIEAVLAALRRRRARRVLDLGCGPGPLLERMLEQSELEAIVAVDISATAIEALKVRFGGRRGLRLVHASFTDPDPRFRGFDAAVLLETVEHVAPSELSRLERSLFGLHRPELVLITTPNAECNPLLGVPPHRFRHPGHRFEWDRARFARWAAGVARRNGYAVSFGGVGPDHPAFGAPTQLAEFRRRAETPEPLGRS